MDSHALRQALSIWQLHKHRRESLWLSLLMSLVIGTLVGLSVVFLAALLSGHVLDRGFWMPGLPVSAALGATIAGLCHGAYRCLERTLPDAQLRRLNEGTSRASLLVFIGIPTACSVLGLIIVDTLLRSLRQGVLVGPRVPDNGTLLTFLFCGALFAGLSLWRLRAQLRSQQAQAQLNEAQLRLLQAQIEPHFLFNTLANVQGLIDYEPAQAKHMLAAFTDYLRASLQQMRAHDVSLAEELALVRNYLDVMQCRMGERLQTRLEVPEALLGVRVPPLLLQPLVENAIHHGLEPQVEGGLLQLRAQAHGEGLLIDIEDNGIGLAASQRRPRRGHGLAMQNLRDRLLANYGPGASLTLCDAGGPPSLTVPIPSPSALGTTGTRARLWLPRLRPSGIPDHA